MSLGCELVYALRRTVAAFRVAPERVAVYSALKKKSGALCTIRVVPWIISPRNVCGTFFANKNVRDGVLSVIYPAKKGHDIYALDGT